MTHAYDEACLRRASDSLGRMLDYSSYSLHYDIPAMMDLFTASGVSARFEHGDIRIICGMSGFELAYEVLERSGLAFERTKPRYTKSLSAEYWCGFTLAQIQWMTCSSFALIMQRFSVQDFLSEYSKKRLSFLDSLSLSTPEAERREMIISFGYSFSSDILSEFLSDHDPEADSEALRSHNALRLYRIRCGLSQSSLAKASGIPVRTIQQYEQGQKDLSRARAEYLISLGRVLNCDPAKLISHFK